MADFAAYLGIDWSDRKHDCCLIEPVSGSKERFVIEHSAQAIDELASRLRSRYPLDEQQIAVSLEQSRGPLIYALLKYGFFVLFPIHPTTLARYREAFSPSRAKDDPMDAEYLAELLVSHRSRLKAWRPDTEQTRTLQYMAEHRRRLVGDRTRISNRMTSLLKCYFPQVLTWFPDLRTDLVADFLLRWPSLESLKGVRRSTLERFFREHNSVRREVIDRRIQQIKESRPLTTDRAVICSSMLMISALASQMKATLAAIRSLDREIERICRAHEDFQLFNSLPGAGEIYASRLLAAMGTDRQRWATAEELACFSGIAPVIERSGRSVWVRWRYFCPKFIRQSFHEYAGESVRHSFWARAYYEQQRAKGKSHHAATRALAYKWIRIIFRCWKTRTPYSEVKYLESLRRSSSPLLAFAAGNIPT
jgi:transposase